MTVKVIMLQNGLEIIGDVKDNVTHYNIEDPVMLQMAPTADGKFTYNMAPFMPYAEERVYPFDKKDVIMIVTPQKELYNSYSKATGTGIQLMN